jgi:predicted esterase YcpF (UPF0227 family)
MTRYLYLHGFASGPESHKAAWIGARLAACGGRIEVPDLNAGDFSHLTLTRQLAVIADLLGDHEGPVVVVGSSFGGYLATLLAERDSRIEQMILLAPAFGFGDLLEQVFGTDTMNRWRSEGRMQLPPEVDSEQRELHYDLVEDLDRHAAVTFSQQPPALVIHGIYDATVPYTRSVDYLRQNSSAQLLLLPDEHSLDTSLEVIWGQMVRFLGLDAPAA